jgi:hydroxypyruvate reductase
MARAAAEWLADSGTTMVSSLVVSHQGASFDGLGVSELQGDHPIPGGRSFEAARRLRSYIAQLPPSLPVEVMISGGASALIAAPIEGLSETDIIRTFEYLNRSGLPIQSINAVRRQITAWSGGRMRTALGERPVRAWLVSDVIDDQLPVIGSGPLIGGAIPGVDLAGLLTEMKGSDLPEPARVLMLAPPPATVSAAMHTIVTSGAVAAKMVARSAASSGAQCTVPNEPIVGDAVEAAKALIAGVKATGQVATLAVWPSETTVRLPRRHGRGGRAQHFALAAAIELHQLASVDPAACDVTVLIAGTDGRDGMTDAAGAQVDCRTVPRIRANGDDPETALTAADSHQVLERAGVLVRTGATGTNVADLVLLWQGPHHGERPGT